MGVKFVDEVPPQVKTTKGKNARIVAQLADKPNEWAIVYRVASRSLAQSRSSALRKLGAEVVTRTDGRQIHVYARIGNEAKKANGAVRVRVRKPRKANKAS